MTEDLKLNGIWKSEQFTCQTGTEWLLKLKRPVKFNRHSDRYDMRVTFIDSIGINCQIRYTVESNDQRMVRVHSAFDIPLAGTISVAYRLAGVAEVALANQERSQLETDQIA